MLLPFLHSHCFIALALLVFSQSFSPLTNHHHSRRISYIPSPLPSSNVASSPANVWRMMILFTSKSLSLVEESSSDLPKFDSAFAEAIGKPFKKWTEENIGETKKKLLSKSPLRKATDKPTTSSTEMSKDLTPTQSIITTEVKKIEEEMKATNLNEINEEDEDNDLLSLHPESIKYREEQLNKKWNELQNKIKQKIQSRSFFHQLIISKSIKELEQFILTKQTITEKEYKQFIIKEKNIMNQLLKEDNKQSALKDLLDLFPEITNFMPKFFKKEDGGLVLCASDDDCPFPLTCCPGFLQTGERFCCSGWGERVMTPAYVTNPLMSSEQRPAGTRDSRNQITSNQGSCPVR